MKIEYEATFTKVDKDEMRERLHRVGAELKRSEFMQKRFVFNLPEGVNISGGWARVRDEGDKVTLSIKAVDGEEIHNQKEVCLTVDSFEDAGQLLELLGCKRKAYQETKRELWLLNGVEITIDTWPFLEPFVEIEGESESVVRTVSEKLGFDWIKAKFCAVDALYEEKYGVTKDKVNNGTPEITFEIENPFSK